MSAFDPASFLDFSMDQPLLKRPPLPVGDYTGILNEPTARSWVSPTDSTKSGIAFDYMADIEVPPDVREALGLTQPTIKAKYGVMVDTMPDGKTLDMGVGKNGGLRRLREALGMNKPGDSFSPRSAAGRPLRFKIGHREYPPGSGELFEEIVGIAAVS